MDRRIANQLRPVIAAWLLLLPAACPGAALAGADGWRTDPPYARIVEGRSDAALTGGESRLSAPGASMLLAQLTVIDALNAPFGVAVDGVGRLYVAETGSHRIVQLAPSGEVLGRWGGEGGAHGQFRFPYGVVLDAAGNVYVADTNNGRVQKLSPSGRTLAVWGELDDDPHRDEREQGREDQGQDHGDGLFDGPRGIAVDRQGNVYVADTNNHRIVQLSPDGDVLADWGESGGRPGQFSLPSGVAVDDAGIVYVADTANQRIQRLSPSGEPMEVWTSAGPQGGPLALPSGVALAPDGSVYVADAGNRRLLKLSALGEYLGQWDATTLGGGTFQGISNVAVGANGFVYVVDGNSGGIQQLSPNGDRLTWWGRRPAGPTPHE
jgi:tripartite motif-containing protein 71